MTTVAVVSLAGAPQRPMPRDTTADDQGLPFTAIGSLIVHASVVVIAVILLGSAPTPAPKEIPVELLQLPEPPKPAEKAPPPPKRPAATPKPAARPEKVAAHKAPLPPNALKPTPPKAEHKTGPKPASKLEAKVDGTTAERLKALLGPMPTLGAVALPGESAAGTEAASYSQLVMSKVAKAKKEGRSQGVPGRSTVAFILGDAGQVVSAEVVRPSGIAALDAEAIAMVHRGAPYPPPPPSARRDYAITLIFRALP